MRPWLVMKWTGILVLLACTHWFAYWLGVKVEHARIADFAEQVFMTREEEVLRERLLSLRILAKYSQAIDVRDVKLYCSVTLTLAKQIEQSAVVPAREAGDDPKADQLQRQIDEARRLVAVLIK